MMIVQLQVFKYNKFTSYQFVYIKFLYIES